MKHVYALLILFFSLDVSAQSLTGKVVSIADGDTFTLLTSDNRQIRIRLHGIDCPEKAQDYGTVARMFLSDLIFGKSVQVTPTDVDRYGRTIGIVSIDSTNVNEALLSAGLAWHYIHFDKNPKWAKLEEKARGDKKGLWSKPNAIAPWKFRRR